MIESPTPSEQKKLCKWHIIAEIMICVLAVLSIPSVFIPLILIPAAFAYPVIAGRLKLLFIPAGVAGAFLLVFLVIVADGVLVLLFFIAIAGAFGVVAGLIIRYFRESRKHIRIIATVIGVVILLVPFLFVFETFTGLMRSPFVSLRVRSYVARHYADYDLRVGRTTYHLKNVVFNTQVHDRNNPDISFSISVHNGKISDGFTSGGFWARTLDRMLTPLLEEEFGDEFHRVTPSIAGVRAGFTSRITGVKIGQPFDLTADVKITARIIITTESAEPEILAEKISRYHAFTSQNGFNFSEYLFHFQYANAPPIRGNQRVIDISLLPELINDDLPALIEHAHNNRNENGVFHTAEFRYVSRVGSAPVGDWR